MYAHVEEQFGLARHAMNVYDRYALFDSSKAVVIEVC